MEDERFRTVKFADLICPDWQTLDEEGRQKAGRYLGHVIDSYFVWGELIKRELPLYRELFKDVINFTGNPEEDLRLASGYKLLERSKRFPDHQISKYDSGTDEILGVINGLPVSDEFLERMVKKPDVYGKYISVSGNYIFDITPDLVGKNRICSSVASRTAGTGTHLIFHALSQSLANEERCLVFTRSNGYRTFKEKYGDTIEKYVELVTAGHLEGDRSALGLHSYLGKKLKSMQGFYVKQKDNTVTLFDAEGFNVVAIFPDSRPADVDSGGYCILGEHKAKAKSQVVSFSA